MKCVSVTQWICERCGYITTRKCDECPACSGQTTLAKTEQLCEVCKGKGSFLFQNDVREICKQCHGIGKQPSRGISKEDIYRMFDEIGLPRGKDQLLLTSHHLEGLAEAILKRLEGV